MFGAPVRLLLLALPLRFLFRLSVHLLLALLETVVGFSGHVGTLREREERAGIRCRVQGAGLSIAGV